MQPMPGDSVAAIAKHFAAKSIPKPPPPVRTDGLREAHITVSAGRAQDAAPEGEAE